MANTTIFDDVLRTFQERLPKLLIPLVNEVFGTAYSRDTKVTRLPEEYQKLLSKVVADSCNQIEGLVYHFECQSRKDGSMILRMVEYDFMLALSDSIRKEQRQELHFPRSCIIYLRSTVSTLEKESLQIYFSDGQKITYQVPVLKLKNYSIDEIFEKNLLILLPYYIINYEKELSKIAADEYKTQQLLAEYLDIIQRLETKINLHDMDIFQDILNMMRRIMNYLLRKQPILNERMSDVMGGKVLPLPSDKLREALAVGHSEGLKEGLSQGLNQGIEQGIIALINTCSMLKATKDITLERLKTEFSLSDEQAKDAIEKYWK